MAGLLYKDFVGIKGKWMVWVFVGFTVVFLALRFVLIGEEYDVALATIPMSLMVYGMFLPSLWTATICKNDEQHKTTQFVKALPLNKNAHIASKYIFIGVAVYIIFSLENIWIIIFNSVAGKGEGAQVIDAMASFIVIFSGATLIIAAVELPFIITLGIKKGALVKTSILEGLMFIVVIYVFFGDMNALENFDITFIVEWYQNHTIFMMFLTIISPVVNIFVYWLSYCITCKINKNREVEIDG